MSFPRYPEYKDSGVDWLGEVPAHWRVKPVKAVATCNDDVLEESTDADYEMEYVEISGVEAGRGINQFQSLSFANAPSRARRRVQDGDVIVSTVRTYLRAIAPVVRPPENMIVSTGFAVIRPRSITSGYLGYLFQAEFMIAAVIARSVGVSYPAINAGELMRLHGALPLAEEQTAIATFLDRETAKIDALVAEQEKLIALLKEKRQTVISHAITKGLDPTVPMKDSGIEWLGEVPAHWDVSKLRYMTSRISSGKTPLGGSETYIDEGITFLRSQNVYDDGLHLDDVVYISDEIDEAMAGSRVQPRDILLNITGASIGRSCMVPMGFGAANVNQHVCVVRLSDPTLSVFVGWFLKSTPIKQQIDFVQEGAAREGLNFQQIGSFAVPHPPVSEQKAIDAFLSDETAKLDTLMAEAEKAVALLKERRSALISAAVTGKIDVRSIVSQPAQGLQELAGTPA